VIAVIINENITVSCDNHCVIEKLHQTPFSSLSYNDKLKIIQEGAEQIILLVLFLVSKKKPVKNRRLAGL
jgi:hypothetical protein